MVNKNTTSRIKYYFKIWILMCRNSFLGYLQNRLGLVIFTTGKMLRFSFFFVFLYFLVSQTQTLAGYNLNQTLFFFLTFSLIDVVSQFLFREVYRFRSYLIDGSFDLILIKPWSALFRSLMGGADLLDLITLPFLIIFLISVGQSLNPSLLHVFLYLVFILNSLLVATAFHIIIISMGFVTLEVDHTVMIYRDTTALGKLPVEIYKQPLQTFLTYLVPVGIMITFPAKVFMGLVTPPTALFAFLVGLIFIFSSLGFWRYAVRLYTSASS